MHHEFRTVQIDGHQVKILMSEAETFVHVGSIMRFYGRDPRGRCFANARRLLAPANDGSIQRQKFVPLSDVSFLDWKTGMNVSNLIEKGLGMEKQTQMNLTPPAASSSASSEVASFDFRGAGVRVHCGNDGEPWFCAKDVCEALGISDAKQAVDTLEADERGGYNVPTPGGIQKTTFISEPGLYALIFKSRKPEAKEFQRWVRRDVLPAIRKTGHYVSPVVSPVVAPRIGGGAVDNAITALVDAIAAEERGKSQAEATDLESRLAAMSIERKSERERNADEWSRLARLCHAKATAAMTGSEDDRLPPEWFGNHRPTQNIPLADAMLALGFKTHVEATDFLSSINVVDSVAEHSRDGGTNQADTSTKLAPAGLAQSRGWLVVAGGEIMVTAKGRGMLEARLGYHTHRYDLRGPIEQSRIRGIVSGVLHAGALPDLRAAFHANREPRGLASTFSCPRLRSIAAE